MATTEARTRGETESLLGGGDARNDANATASDRRRAEDERGWDDGDGPRAEDGGRAYDGRLLGVQMSETAALVTASTA